MRGFIALQTALGRMGEADDIGVAPFLCTDAAGWVNAQRLEASGGMFLYARTQSLRRRPTKAAGKGRLRTGFKMSRARRPDADSTTVGQAAATTPCSF